MTDTAYKEVLRIINFVVTLKLDLKIEPEIEEDDWHIIVDRHSDWPGDSINWNNINDFKFIH